MSHGYVPFRARDDCRQYPKQKRQQIPVPKEVQKPDFSPIGSKIDFQKIFGVPTLERAIRLLIRVYRIKRVCHLGTATMYWHFKDELDVHKDILWGRRFHHLTSSRRGNMPYRGDSPANLLLLRKERHKALHLFFGYRTLEEIIVILLRLHCTGPVLCGRLRQYYAHSCSFQSKASQHKKREEILSHFCQHLSNFRPRIFSGGPFFDSEWSIMKERYEKD